MHRRPAGGAAAVLCIVAIIGESSNNNRCAPSNLFLFCAVDPFRISHGNSLYASKSPYITWPLCRALTEPFSMHCSMSASCRSSCLIAMLIIENDCDPVLDNSRHGDPTNVFPSPLTNWVSAYSPQNKKNLCAIPVVVVVVWAFKPVFVELLNYAIRRTTVIYIPKLGRPPPRNSSSDTNKV